MKPIITLFAIIALNLSCAEDMCGPNLDIPCSLYGCGGPNEDGIYGQLPCENNYPRDCQFTFKSTLADYEERVIALDIQKFTIPAVSEFGGASVQLNSVLVDPIVYTVTGEEILGCNVTAVSYVKCVKQNFFWNVECTLETLYPDLSASTSASDDMLGIKPLEGLFSMYGDFGGKEISINPISNVDAASLYSALRNTATVLSVECLIASTIEVVDSCIMFEVVPTNESPDLATQDALVLNAAYRFLDPPVPALTFQETISGSMEEYVDVVMNVGNPITTLYGVTPPYCNGTVVEYQAEDGTWISFFLGLEGYYYDLEHILYVDSFNMYSSTIQMPWGNLEATLAGRNLRMEVECLTSIGVSLGVGYLYFGTTYAPWAGEAITCTGQKANPTFCLTLPANF